MFPLHHVISALQHLRLMISSRYDFITADPRIYDGYYAFPSFLSVDLDS